jgi:hypothetical protein
MVARFAEGNPRSSSNGEILASRRITRASAGGNSGTGHEFRKGGEIRASPRITRVVADENGEIFERDESLQGSAFEQNANPAAGGTDPTALRMAVSH